MRCLSRGQVCVSASALVVLESSGTHAVREATGAVPEYCGLGAQLLSISPGCTMASPTLA